ncbi:MAG: hypothetical protein KBC64_02020 [Simkaniaceae bacterium]|nr:hypothetical protein [Simkaniaceae bacterium]
MSQANRNSLQDGPLAGLPSLPSFDPNSKPTIQKGFGMGDVDVEVMDMIKSAMSSNVQDTNYAYMVIVLFIALGLTPLQMGIGDLGSNINANSQFQELMTQFQSIFTYLEASPSMTGAPAGGPAIMPSGWQNTAVGAAKIEQLLNGFGSFFYGINIGGGGDPSLPTWNDLFFTIRLSDGSYQKIPLVNAGVFNSNIMGLMNAFAGYFSLPQTWHQNTIPGGPGNPPLDPTTKVPGLYLLLFKDIQLKLDQSKSFVSPDLSNLGEIYGVADASGHYDPASFGTVNSSIAGANDFWVQLQTCPVFFNGNQIPFNDSNGAQYPELGSMLYQTLTNNNGMPSNFNEQQLVIALAGMAQTYWVSQNPNDPTTNLPWVGSAGAKGSLVDTLDSSAGNAQSSADKDNQNQMTQLQAQSQEITSEVQTGQSIQSTEAKSEAAIIQNQKAS